MEEQYNNVIMEEQYRRTAASSNLMGTGGKQGVNKWSEHR